MPSHIDAVGYLSDLSREINEPWFKMVCDLSVFSGVPDLDQLTCDTLAALYTKRASYIGIGRSIAAIDPPAATIPINSLDQLSGFENFKLLGNALEITFRKKITLIFGANGSGKSSLCESLKVLATSEPPNRPLHNVRRADTATPTFHYKFKNDAVLQTWSPTDGYGPRRTTIKYFDTDIAIKNVQSAVEPGRIIILTPFRLQIFEHAKELTTKFRAALQKAQLDNQTKMIQVLEKIRTEFKKFNGSPLASIDDKTTKVLATQISLGEGFAEQELLREKILAVAELEKATSEEGLKLLKAEYRELETVLVSCAVSSFYKYLNML